MALIGKGRNIIPEERPSSHREGTRTEAGTTQEPQANGLSEERVREIMKEEMIPLHEALRNHRSTPEPPKPRPENREENDSERNAERVQDVRPLGEEQPTPTPPNPIQGDVPAPTPPKPPETPKKKPGLLKKLFLG